MWKHACTRAQACDATPPTSQGLGSNTNGVTFDEFAKTPLDTASGVETDRQVFEADQARDGAKHNHEDGKPRKSIDHWRVAAHFPSRISTDKV
jgi:hypothetical protein